MTPFASVLPRPSSRRAARIETVGPAPPRPPCCAATVVSKTMVRQVAMMTKPGRRTMKTPRLRERDARPLANRTDVVSSFGVFLGRLQVLEHQRRVHRQLRQLPEIRRIVNLSSSRNNFPESHRILGDPLEIFRVARDDPFSELRKALDDELIVSIEAGWRVDPGADVHVHGEARSVHRSD